MTAFDVRENIAAMLGDVRENIAASFIFGLETMRVARFSFILHILLREQCTLLISGKLLS